jgi:hypothetical protein
MIACTTFAHCALRLAPIVKSHTPNLLQKGGGMKKASCLIWILLGFGYWAFAGEPDFSGNWTLLREDGIFNGTAAQIEGGEADNGMVITHTGNRLVVESRCVRCLNQNEIREYIIDGKRRNMPGKQNGVISYSAEWNGQALIIERGFGGTTPFGQATVRSRQVWALSAEKQVLTIATSAMGSNTELTSTQVYKRLP